MMKDSMGILSEIVSLTGMENSIFRILLKTVGIGYLVEFSAGILNDMGATSVADKVVLAGRLTVIIMSFPILNGLLSIVKQFISLI